MTLAKSTLHVFELVAARITDGGGPAVFTQGSNPTPTIVIPDGKCARLDVRVVGDHNQLDGETTGHKADGCTFRTVFVRQSGGSVFLWSAGGAETSVIEAFEMLAACTVTMLRVEETSSDSGVQLQIECSEIADNHEIDARARVEVLIV